MEKGVMLTCVPCKGSKLDHTHPLIVCQQLIIHKANVLLKNGIEHGHVVVLALVRVREEEVRLVWDQLGNGNLLDPEDQIRPTQVSNNLRSSLNNTKSCHFNISQFPQPD